jgi:hypothetical protein
MKPDAGKTFKQSGLKWVPFGLSGMKVKHRQSHYFQNMEGTQEQRGRMNLYNLLFVAHRCVQISQYFCASFFCVLLCGKKRFNMICSFSRTHLPSFWIIPAAWLGKSLDKLMVKSQIFMVKLTLSPVELQYRNWWFNYRRYIYICHVWWLDRVTSSDIHINSIVNDLAPY